MIPSDIQPLIRLAATLPVGSLDRRTILASLKKEAAFADDLVARVDVMSGSMGGKEADRGPLLKAVQSGLPESVFDLEEFTAEAFPRYGVDSLADLRKAEDLTDEDRAELKSLESRIKPFSAMVAKVEKWSGTKLGQDLAEGLSLVSGKTDHKLREAVWAGVAKGMHGDVEKLESGRRVVTDTGRGSLTTPGALGTEPEDLVQVMLAGGIELPGMIFDKNMSDKTYYEGVRVRGTFKPRKELFKPGTSVYTLAGAKIKPTKISELRSVRGYAKSVASTTAIDWKRSVHIGTEYILAEGDASAPDPEHAMNMGGKVSLESLLGADLIDGVTVSKQMTLARYYIKKIRQVLKRVLPKGVQMAIWEAVAEMIAKGINPWKGQGRGGEFAVDYNAIEKFLDTRDGQKILDENEITADSINKNNVQKNWVRVREKMLKALSQLSDDDLLASIHLSLAAGGMVDDVPEYIQKIKRDKDLYQTYISDMRKYGSTRVAKQVIKSASERRAMIRLAATLPVGSPERRAILAGCEKPEGKTARLMKRHEAILRKYLDSAGSRAVMDYDALPSSVRSALERVKFTETLWSDVNRWLMDNNNPHLARWAKKELPDALKKNQFTSKDGDNPPPADADGDGKTNEEKPDFLKGKKAALVRLAAALPVGSSERKTILRMASEV